MTIAEINTCRLCGGVKCFHTDEEWRAWKACLPQKERDKAYSNYSPMPHKPLKLSEEMLKAKVMMYLEASMTVEKIAVILQISNHKISNWSKGIKADRLTEKCELIKQLLLTDMPQSAIAKQVGVSPAYVSRIKHGTRGK